MTKSVDYKQICHVHIAVVLVPISGSKVRTNVEHICTPTHTQTLLEENITIYFIYADIYVNDAMADMRVFQHNSLYFEHCQDCQEFQMFVLKYSTQINL